jgi:hypothetical protein
VANKSSLVRPGRWVPSPGHRQASRRTIASPDGQIYELPPYSVTSSGTYRRNQSYSSLANYVLMSTAVFNDSRSRQILFPRCGLARTVNSGGPCCSTILDRSMPSVTVRRVASSFSTPRPTLPRWRPLSGSTVLLEGPFVNRKARRRRVNGQRERYGTASRVCPGPSGRLGQPSAHGSPSASAAMSLASLMSPQRAVLAGDRRGTGSRRRAPAAPPPRPAGRPRSGRGARSGRRSSRASRARS